MHENITGHVTCASRDESYKSTFLQWLFYLPAYAGILHQIYNFACIYGSLYIIKISFVIPLIATYNVLVMLFSIWHTVQISVAWLSNHFKKLYSFFTLCKISDTQMNIILIKLRNDSFLTRKSRYFFQWGSSF